MTNARALGIVFPNQHDDNIPQLIQHRTMASVPFAGRYRMIDFCLSGMAQAGIQSIGILVQQNFQSLMDHLGNGREWDLSSKRGGLTIFPPYARDGGKLYRGRIESIASIMDFLLRRREEYVVMSDCNIACSLDLAAFVDDHRKAGADLSVLYEKREIPEEMRGDNVTFKVNDEDRITEVRINDYKPGVQNVSMNIYVIGRQKLIDVVNDMMVRGQTGFEKDFLGRHTKLVNARAVPFRGYSARIYSMQSYFAENMRLLQPANLAKLFPEDIAIYTKVRDEAPVRFGLYAKVNNSLIADGCIVEGEVENCVLFRGVRVGRGARLKNSIVMQGSVIEANARMEYVVTDKDVLVGEGQRLQGAKNFPVYVGKGSRVT